MRILVLGVGNVGKAIAHDLSDDFEITIADISEKDLEEVEKYGETKKVNASNYSEILNSMEGFDLVIGALPGEFGYKTLEAAIEAEKDIVSVSFMPDNFMNLHDKAKEAGVTVIPDAGFGPGISNVCMGKMNKIFDEFNKGNIWIGGLPQNPDPPLFYRATFSPIDTISEYTREARIVNNGKVKKLDPLDDFKKTKIRDFEFESFISDGLRSLTETIDAKNMKEWTLRWKGHLEKMKTLRKLGFFKKGNVEDTLDVIMPHMTSEGEDFSIMKIEGRGKVDGKEKEIEYYLYDEEKNFTSMARVTGFTTAIITRIAAEKEIKSGVIPPENLDLEASSKILEELRKRGITIEENNTQ